MRHARPHPTGILTIVALAASLATTGARAERVAASPGFYTRHETWPETLAATRAFIAASAAARERHRLAATGVRKAASEPVRISVDVSGADVLWLLTGDGGDGNQYDHTVWAAPVLVGAGGGRTPLTELRAAVTESGWGEVKYVKARLGGREYPSALLCHASGRVRFDLGGRFARFEAWAGINYSSRGRGSATFAVSTHENPLPPGLAASRAWERACADFPAHAAVARSLAEPYACARAFLLTTGCGKLAPPARRLAARMGAWDDGAAAAFALVEGLRPASERDWLEVVVPLVDDAGRLLAARDELKDRVASLAEYTPDFDLDLARLSLLAGAAGSEARGARRDITKLEGRLRGLEARLVAGGTVSERECARVDADLERVAARLARKAGWPMARADAHRSAVSHERVPDHPALGWTYVAPVAPRPAWPEPATRNLSAGSGPLSPTVDFDEAYHVVGAGGRLYFGTSGDDAIRCLDARTGRVVWSFTAEGPVRAAPVLHGGNVYAGSDDGNMYCLDARTGAVAWVHAPGGEAQRLPGNGRIVSTVPVRGGALVWRDVLYFASGLFPREGVYVTALDAAGGRVRVNAPFPNTAQGYLAVSGDRLVIPTGRTPASMGDRDTGEETAKLGKSDPWGRDLKGGSHAVAVDRWVVTGPSEDGHLHLFGDGDEEEVIRTPGLQLIAHRRRAYILRRASLVAARRRDFFIGKKVAKEWEAPCPDACAMMVAGDVVVCGARDRVRAFDARTGARRWERAVEGRAVGLAACDGQLVVSTDRGRIHCFAPEGGAPPREEAPAATLGPPAADRTALVSAALEATDRRRGYALIVGATDAAVALDFVVRTELRVIVRAQRAATVDRLRDELRAARVYGERVVVHHGIGRTLPYRHRLFNVVVRAGRGGAATARELLRVLRPEGGVLVVDAGAREADLPGEGLLRAYRVTRRGAHTYVRGALDGAGEWRHGYADAGNTACSGEEMPFGRMRLQWFGRPGPERMADRHLKSPPPVYARGVTYVTGLDLITALDSYNGTVMWEKALRDSGRVATMRQSPNMVACDDGVLVAHGNAVSKFAAAGGGRVAKMTTPGRIAEWGYLALVDGVMLGSETKPKAAFRQNFLWSDRATRRAISSAAFQGSGPFICSDALFAIEPEDGRVRWGHAPRRGVIVNPCIACADGRVVFLECPSAEAAAAHDGRAPVDALRPGARLVSLEIATGEVAWTTPADLSVVQWAMFLSATPRRVVLTSSRHVKVGDRKRNRYDMQAFDARTGAPAWRTTGVPNYDTSTRGGHGELNQHPFIVEGVIYGTGFARHIADGREYDGWKWRKGHKCSTVSASGTCAFTRYSGRKLPYMFDLATGRAEALTLVSRPGCWINMLAVGGMIVIPEASSGCTCGYPVQTSLALSPAE